MALRRRRRQIDRYCDLRVANRVFFVIFIASEFSSFFFLPTGKIKPKECQISSVRILDKDIAEIFLALFRTTCEGFARGRKENFFRLRLKNFVEKFV